MESQVSTSSTQKPATANNPKLNPLCIFIPPPTPFFFFFFLLLLPLLLIFLFSSSCSSLLFFYFFFVFFFFFFFFKGELSYHKCPYTFFNSSFALNYTCNFTFCCNQIYTCMYVCMYTYRWGRSQWTRGTRSGSEAARLLGIRFRITPGVWMSV
jgi:hypothetical protein